MAADAESFKAEGNSYYSQGLNQEAVDSYTKAIGISNSNPVYYSNRAAAYMKLGRWQAALDDCNKGLSFSHDVKLGSKLYWRQGICHRELGSLSLAEESFNEGLRRDPSNSVLREELARLQDILSSAPVAQTDSGLSEIKNNDSTASPINASESETTIPIQVVDTLPDIFSEPSAKVISHDDSNKTSHLHPLESIPTATDEKRNVQDIASPSASTSAQPALPLQIPSPLTFYNLMQLMRTPKSQLPQVYDHIFFNVPPSRYAEIHQTGGIDYEVIEFVLDSIAFVATNAQDKNWASRAVDILEGLAHCNRFSMSKMFVSTKRVQEVQRLLAESKLDASTLSRINDLYT
ncbi:Hsp90 cochaperone STI1 [Sugiyamaella lignohabitans]|uniref:RNA polymerase II-associated protein 3 n=1 Tax=Sugiyamaella lignohabitans TaxID=796027 RepID=A0A167E627_9ASCO|nr:Hsp90 cochaperone STI1 [Sugiyamaella lignohabitans]ANB13688.1 Hsp90 cochaperone STI1 [Sugiyamaella lignohabitans]